VLQGWRHQGKRASPTDSPSHTVDEGTQPDSSRTNSLQPAVERRTDFPRVQESRDRIHTTRHLQRVAAGASWRKLHQGKWSGTVRGGVQHVRRYSRPDCQQQLRNRNTAVRQFHDQRKYQVRDTG